MMGVCGDGIIDPGEQCDDGNTTPGDGCDAACQLEVMGVCGDGVVDPGEQCDDGNTMSGDGCDDMCQLETMGICGDGTMDPGEQCDDGNLINGDGCDDMCQLEMMGMCGDGVLDPGEQCDDGNTMPGDGCDAMCQIEAIACDGSLGAIACGGTDTDDTSVSGVATNSAYPTCFGFTNDGPEVFYTFTAAATELVQVDLSGLTADLDLFVFEDFGAGCDTNACDPALNQHRRRYRRRAGDVHGHRRHHVLPDRGELRRDRRSVHHRRHLRLCVGLRRWHRRPGRAV